MDSFALVLFKTIDNDTFNKLNNYIYEQQVSFNIKKNNNSHYFDLVSNNPTLDIQSFLQDKTSDSINVITIQDYKSLIDLMFNENHSIIKYNDINILQITFYCKFDTTNKNINHLQSKFKSYLT